VWVCSDACTATIGNLELGNFVAAVSPAVAYV